MSSSSTFRRVWSQQDLPVTEVDAVPGLRQRQLANAAAALANDVATHSGHHSGVPEDAAVVLANAAAALVPVLASVVRDALGAPHMWCSRRHPYNAVLANAARKRCHPRSPTTPRTAVLSDPSTTVTPSSKLPHARSHVHRVLERNRRRTHQTQTPPPPRTHTHPVAAYARHPRVRVCTPSRHLDPCTSHARTGGTLHPEAHLPRPTPYPIAPPAAPRPCTHAHRRRRVRTPPPRPRLHATPAFAFARPRLHATPASAFAPPSRPSTLHARTPPSPRTHITPTSAFARHPRVRVHAHPIAAYARYPRVRVCTPSRHLDLARTHAAPRVHAKQTSPPSRAPVCMHPTLLHALPTTSTPPTSREPRTRMRAAAAAASHARRCCRLASHAAAAAASRARTPRRTPTLSQRAPAPPSPRTHARRAAHSPCLNAHPRRLLLARTLLPPRLARGCRCRLARTHAAPRVPPRAHARRASHPPCLNAHPRRLLLLHLQPHTLPCPLRHPHLTKVQHPRPRGVRPRRAELVCPRVRSPPRALACFSFYHCRLVPLHPNPRTRRKRRNISAAPPCACPCGPRPIHARNAPTSRTRAGLKRALCNFLRFEERRERSVHGGEWVGGGGGGGVRNGGGRPAQRCTYFGAERAGETYETSRYRVQIRAHLGAISVSAACRRKLVDAGKERGRWEEGESTADAGGTSQHVGADHPAFSANSLSSAGRRWGSGEHAASAELCPAIDLNAVGYGVLRTRWSNTPIAPLSIRIDSGPPPRKLAQS
ncbi:hypothetical protein B0H16DRAFT_1806855 [Mycena metata]|uniref:Uncharacterized protein n=1 Tax=Mycena metata TaxID=1033252 RepID=A0AAD7MFA6_9AGAR|nr:hypothetical protein B0H16DRAFT_1806855 [Mycena metata]